MLGLIADELATLTPGGGSPNKRCCRLPWLVVWWAAAGVAGELGCCDLPFLLGVDLGSMERRKAFTVPRELHVRGMTVEEAILELEKYIDDAMLARFSDVRIVHGKGTGALRRGVHAFLRKHPQVKEFRLAEHSEGGEGATEVSL